jgi:anaerobic magnesium-protoporphyrin IX monomethyl ester cyclase
MKVVLVNPPNTIESTPRDVDVFIAKLEPLGLLYLAASLEQAGIETAVVDAFSQGLSLAATVDMIAASSPDVIGISFVTSAAVVAEALCVALRKRCPQARIALGHCHASVFHEYYLRAKVADFVFHGEAERSLVDVVEALRDSRTTNGIAGVTFLDGDRVAGDPTRQYIDDLDSLPLPARHLVNMALYGESRTINNPYVPRRGEKTRTMFASRGCVTGCTFCVTHDQRRFRFRAADAVVAEMHLLKDKYNAGFIMFLDSLFTGNKARVAEICGGIRSSGLGIPWCCDAHVNHVTRELLAAMRAAGCHNIRFGIESGNNDVLKRIHKGTTVERIRSAVAMTREAGIKAGGYFMLGLPADTPATMQQTIDLAVSLKLDFAQFGIAVPYPGSEWYAELKKDGILPSTAEEERLTWEHYASHAAFTGLDPVYTPKGLSAAQLVGFQRRAIRTYYLRPREIVRYCKRLSWGNLAALVRAALSLFRG